MGRCSGRAWAYAAVALLMLAVPALRPALARDRDEVIVDPELSQGRAGSGSANAPVSARAPDGDEVIADPELSGSAGADTGTPKDDSGWGEVLPPKEGEAGAAAPDEDEYDPLANTGIAKLEVLGQTAIDMHSERDLEDFYESRLRFGGEIELRVSRKLRLSLGTRLDFMWAAPNRNDTYLKRPVRYYDGSANLLKDRTLEGGVTRARNQADDGTLLGPSNYNQGALDQDRYELDIVPLSAYVDLTLADGVHMRLGTQVISLGRMDGYSATDILAVFDLRPQPKLDPSAIKLAQPALRLDWDISSWATLQLAYVPWFMPHVIRPNRDRYTATALTGSGSVQAFGGGDDAIDPSFQPKVTESNIRYLGPPPDFKHPQAEARLNFRGSTFEVALLGGTALEKIPSIYYIPAVDEYLRNPDPDRQSAVQSAIGGYALNRYPLFDVAYHRYYLVGFDGSFDISPLQVGFEFGYSPERHLYASNKKGEALPMPNTTEQICNPGDPPTQADAPRCNTIVGADSKGNLMDGSIRKGVPVVQGTLHVEWLKDESFAVAAEAFLIQALELPHDRQRDWTGFIPRTGVFAGGLIAGNYALDEGKYRADLTAMVMVGPSFIIGPQVEMRVLEGMYINLGAQVFEGPDPQFKSGLAARNLTVGGLFSGYDNVYLGFRWLP